MRGAWYCNRDAGATVRFTLRGLDYEVPLGSVVEIPADLAWYPPQVGLRLERVDGPSASPLAPEPTPHLPARRRLPTGVAVGPSPVPRDEDDDEAAEAVPVAPEVADSLARRKRR